MDNFHLRLWYCRAFDVLLGDINISFDPYLFSELLENTEPICDYVFLSQEHFDHCYPKTLLKLCQDDRFKKPFAPISCLTPNDKLTDVNAFLEDLREKAGEKTKLLPFTAPIFYAVEIPEIKLKWNWEWFNSWTVPPWREG